MTAKRDMDRKLSRWAPPVLGILAIALSVASMACDRWSVERVANDWWALASIGGITLGVIAIARACYNYWREIPRGSRRDVSIAVALGVMVPVVVVGVFARVVSQPNVDLGSLPAWISAGGALFTAGGVLLALHSYRSSQRADLEDQASQVRLLGMAALPGGQKDGKQHWTTEFVNNSDGPLYSLRIHGFRAQVIDGAPTVLMRPIEKIHLDDDPRRRNPMTFPGTAWHPKLSAGEQVRTLWEADANADTPVAPGHYTAIWYSVTDANGRSWNVADNYAPTKIPRPSRPFL
ncbi:hypothetical protein HQO90_20800 [Rhodococcus fascians]|nr:hypothetical protein [Rhodococcus fascians]MBY4056990.1 hypothetical protein [Rhodococcus fascians]MBY4066296.1 hypothetical protein [Rhodococcus fascians]